MKNTVRSINYKKVNAPSLCKGRGNLIFNMALILFIDDEPLTLKLLSQAADIVGHTAITSTTADEGLRLAEKENPDLIFLDLNLKEMDGRSVFKLLRENPATEEIPVVFLSAGVNMSTADLIQTVGANGYLEKPIRLQTLLDVIREFTDDAG